MTNKISPQSYTRKCVLTDELALNEVGKWLLTSCGTMLTCPGPGRGANKAPSVYVIASVGTAGEAIVLYVGKASDGWGKRRGLHLGNRKRRFHQVIIAQLNENRRVLVFERQSGWSVHDGFRAPTHDAEEVALMARFRPTINRPSDVHRAVRFQNDTIATAT
jgi:hypothetical protein